jgi:hypothetical protein
VLTLVWHSKHGKNEGLAPLARQSFPMRQKPSLSTAVVRSVVQVSMHETVWASAWIIIAKWA